MAAKIATQYTIHYPIKNEQKSGQMLFKFLKTMLMSSLPFLYPLRVVVNLVQSLTEPYKLHIQHCFQKVDGNSVFQ